jgi:hypothetical protein
MTDEELLGRFERCELTHWEWNHEAHVRVAYMYVSGNPFETAMDKIRSGIQRLNSVHCVPETAIRGYNETTTPAFAQLIASTISAYGEALPTLDSLMFCQTHPHLMQKTILRLYYSPARRIHPDAKAHFIEPDLAPLPTILN